MYGYYGRYGDQKLTDDDGPGAGAGNQGYVDVAPPPPPPPQTGTADQWVDPYANRPPLVSVPVGGSTSTTGSTFSTIGSSILTGLTDIFGRPAALPGGQVPLVQPVSTGLPLAAWVAIAVGGVVVLGVAARALRTKRAPSTAGYRRKSRRSRR